ncbi:cell surface protein [uncultured Brachyspira sp.]|uniref:cell surface protein n=1 Tax=uncultured Brachyspira sp. TaxID=221953 RepID=UPI00261F55FB|nr:cell surface protein [uncultured Brachyspira sp.]
MKKVLLTAMALLTIASASAFGMYGADNGWIDFLVHGNQLRARMDQLGFTLGNGMIKGTFGFKGNTGGLIMHAVSGNEIKNNDFATLDPTISMGIGYTSPVFGIGVGYNYTFKTKDFGIHTPVLAVNALNDNLRIAVPIQIGVAGNSSHDNTYVNGIANGTVKENYTSVSMDPQIRYYTGIDAVSHIRLTLKYGMASYKAGTIAQTLQDYVASSFGFEFRIHFLKSTVGNVVVDPFFRVTYNTALEGNSYSVTAGDRTAAVLKTTAKDRSKPYEVFFEIPVGLNASSDIVTLYLEPKLGYGFEGQAGGATKVSTMKHKLVWGAYGEIYITPVKDLEWYFEAEIGNGPSYDDWNNAIHAGNGIKFNTSTGITWYLPSLGGATE